MSINRNNARTQCESLGTGYKLITNAQWQTIARNIEQVAENWSGGAVGSGALNRGHSDTSPSSALAASTDDNQACYGTGEDCNASTWDLQKRTHKLSNGEVIWDFAGNVWEWVYDDYALLDVNPALDAQWYDYNDASVGANNRNLFGPSKASWSAAQGMGRIFGGSGGAVHRGGFWGDIRSGVFAAALDRGSSYLHAGVGFRCVFTP